jgi:transcriptional regulator with XRE-family HTH domain
MVPTNIRYTLATLIKEQGITEAELSRQTGIPAPTLNRLLAGATPDPRVSTLRPLAKFFNITIDQLLGDLPLTANRLTRPSINRLGARVPLIAWEQVSRWEDLTREEVLVSWENWAVTNASTNAHAYAVQIPHRSLEPRFPYKTILIIDPVRAPEDSDYVLVHHIADSSISLKRLLIDGKTWWLKPLHENIQAILINDTDKICGVVLEAQVPCIKD